MRREVQDRLCDQEATLSSIARAIAAGAVVVAALAACGSDRDESRLETPGGGEVGGEFPNVTIGHSIVFPLRDLCTTGSPIHIISVEPKSATGGMRIASWGTRYIGPDSADSIEPNQGGIPGAVGQIRGFSTTNAVRSRCGKTFAEDDASDETDQFDVSLAASSPRATMKGVVVRYGADKTLFVQFGAAICSTPDCAEVQ